MEARGVDRRVVSAAGPCKGSVGIKYVSLGGSLGYSIAARRYMLALNRRGVPITWTPMVPHAVRNWELEPFDGSAIGDDALDAFCNRPIEYDTVIVHTPPEYFPSWAEREQGKKIVGCTVWETDRAPGHWPDLLNSVHHLMVPCHWNKEVFQSCGVRTPISVIPHLMEKCEASAGPASIWRAGSGDYVFYTIGTWMARKAVWDVITCYLDTFKASDPTLLIVKTNHYGYHESLLGRWSIMRYLGAARRRFCKAAGIRPRQYDAVEFMRTVESKYRFPPRIQLVTEDVDEGDISKLHRRGDCFVSLCRSEGWGLGAFDAACWGKPVIMTGFGGQLDFLPPDLAYLVDYRLVPVRDDVDRRNFTRDQKWARPDLAHASQLMRRVFENREEARRKGEMLREHVRSKFREDEIVSEIFRMVCGVPGR